MRTDNEIPLEGCAAPAKPGRARCRATAADPTSQPPVTTRPASAAGRSASRPRPAAPATAKFGDKEDIPAETSEALLTEGGLVHANRCDLPGSGKSCGQDMGLPFRLCQPVWERGHGLSGKRVFRCCGS